LPAPEVEHRADKVPARPAEEPGAADDPAVTDVALALQLRAAVDGERPRLVRLDVRRALPPVEDVIRREVDHRRPETDDVPRTEHVDRLGAVRIDLCSVDVRPRRRVEHTRGPVVERLAHDVERLAVARVGVGEDLPKRGPELAAGARDQDASLASRSDRIGDRALQRSRTRGSFQAIPCSSGSDASYSSVTW